MHWSGHSGTGRLPAARYLCVGPLGEGVEVWPGFRGVLQTVSAGWLELRYSVLTAGHVWRSLEVDQVTVDGLVDATGIEK